MRTLLHLPTALALAGIVVAGIVLTGCADSSFNLGRGLEGVVGSGRLVNQDYGFEDFNEIEVSHAFQLEVARSDSFGVAVAADDNLVDRLDVRQTGRTVSIGLKPGNYSNTTQKAKVSLPDLRRLDLSGASRDTIAAFQTPGTLVLGLSGASMLVGKSSASGPQANLSGAANLSLEGAADSLRLDSSGASTAELGSYAVKSADVRLSGASRASVNIAGKLDVDLSGASILSYAGSPTMGTVNTSGGSSLQRK